MKPLILVTNDDGIESPGLFAVVDAISMLGEVLVVAPKTQQTGMGRAFPQSEKVGIIEVVQSQLEGIAGNWYAVHGSPAQAAAHGVLEIAPRLPALCISGINYGENLGASILKSGTVGAALEAASYNIPSIALSLGAASWELFSKPYNNKDWSIINYFVHKFASELLTCNWSAKVALLNINIPSTVTLQTAIRSTCQSHQNYYSCAKPEKRDFSINYTLPLKVAVNYENLELDSDIYGFVIDKVISVTPLGTDLTARDSSGKLIQL